ncbi:MAG: hypothetical protein AAGL89_11380 [Pseudomonadota bacterium]
MGYLEQKLAELQAVGAAMIENPLLFIIAFAIGLPLILWKWRVVGRSQTKAMSDLTHGFRAQADTRTARHDTGIGTKDVLVMRPNKLGGMIWFALIFFGGGAVFFFTLVLPEEPTRDNWMTFTGLAAFSLFAMGLIEANQTRIIVDDTGIERRRILHRRQRIAFTDIVTADLNTKAASPVLKLTTRDGRSMRIRATYSGFMTLLSRLSKVDAKVALMGRMLDARSKRAAA